MSNPAELSDGVVLLRCLRPADAPDHLAGEDDDQVRWLSEAPASLADVVAWIDENRQQWASGGPRRNLAIWDVEARALVGNIEAHFDSSEPPYGDAHIAYVVFPSWRGRGIAARSVALVCAWLSADTTSTAAVIRVAVDNVYSHGVARASGFTEVGDDGPGPGPRMIRYELRLR